jgi:hypothetical protein
VDDRVDRDAGLVHLRVGDPAAVRRPPEAAAAVHLLLGDVLGEAVGHSLLRPRGQPPLQTGVDVDRVKVAAAHEGEPAAIGRQLRVLLRSFGLRQADRLASRSRQVEIPRPGVDDAVGLLGQDELGDPAILETEPLAAQDFLAGRGPPGVRGPGQNLAPAARDLLAHQHPDVRVAVERQVIKDAAVVGEPESGRDPVARRWEPRHALEGQSGRPRRPGRAQWPAASGRGARRRGAEKSGCRHSQSHDRSSLHDAPV